MLRQSEIAELPRLFKTVREARRVLLLSDMPYGDITELPTGDVRTFWRAVADRYEIGYRSHSEILLRANILEQFSSNLIFLADTLENFNPAERRLIAYAMETLNTTGQVEVAAADLLAVRATHKNNNVGEGFGVVLRRLREVASATRTSREALEILEAEGAATGQAIAATKKQLADELERVSKDDPAFARELTKAVHDAHAAATPMEGDAKTVNHFYGNNSGIVIQARSIDKVSLPPSRPD